jgi:hypothetical protein
VRVVHLGAHTQTVEHLDDGPVGAIHQLDEVQTKKKNKNLSNKVSLNYVYRTSETFVKFDSQSVKKKNQLNRIKKNTKIRIDAMGGIHNDNILCTFPKMDS